MNPPDQYIPRSPDDLIGAKTVALATSLLKHAKKLSQRLNVLTYKLLLFGDPGNGKTSIAQMIASVLAANKIDIQTINGRNVTIDTVREWQQGSAYGSLFGGWKVKLINEADLIPPVAQDLMLTYLDDLPGSTAVIATSNASMTTLTDRFATRFGPIKVDCPTSEEISAFLVRLCRLPRKAADFIAVGCCGNVRDALLRSANYLIVGEIVERPKPSPSFVIKTRTAVARTAWENSQVLKNGKRAVPT